MTTSTIIDPTPPTLVGLRTGLEWFNQHKCVDYMGADDGEVFVRVNCGRLKRKEESALSALGWVYQLRGGDDMYLFKTD